MKFVCIFVTLRGCVFVSVVCVCVCMCLFVCVFARVRLFATFASVLDVGCGFVCCGKASTAATFEIRDGGATGTIVFQYSIPSNANMNSFSIQFPGDGIRCSTDAYVTFSVGSVTCLSVFYG